MKAPILSKPEAKDFIALCLAKGIKVVTHLMGGCSAWKKVDDHFESMHITARHYGILKLSLERKSLI